MARAAHVVITNDIDGSDGAESIRFGMDSEVYEIDLTPAHQAEMTDVLAPFIGAARKAGGAAPRRPAAGRRDRVAVRAWARDQGIEIADCGAESASAS